MAKKLYTITIPTTGYEVYEVAADSEADAVSKLCHLNSRDGDFFSLGKLQTEESHGDWVSKDEWEIEEGDEE